MDEEVIEAISMSLRRWGVTSPGSRASILLAALRAEGFDVYRPGDAQNVWQCEDEWSTDDCEDEDDRDDRRAVHGGHDHCGWRLRLVPAERGDQ